ncbi:MAG: TlpA family protein disulfide reductase [Solirubrobacterales bacterium]|nr:TlpA family protein disulfide reductase [Solirubrobacterales bacterium]
MSAESAPARRGPLRYAGRTVALLLAAALVALLAFGLLTTSPDSTIDDALAEARPVPAPGFELDVLTRGTVPPKLAGPVRRAAADGRIDLRELRGTPVVLNFWASWCIPCREEAPLLQRSWMRHGRDGVLFLGLNMQDVRDDARGFLAEFEQTFPHVRDPTNDVARDWGTTGIPETFFIRRDGRVVGHVIGVVSEPQIEEGIAAAKAGRTQDAARGGAQRPQR